MQYWKKEMANEEDSVIVGATGPNWVDVTPRDIMVECKEREMPYQKNEVSNEAYYPPDELAGPRNWVNVTPRDIINSIVNGIMTALTQPNNVILGVYGSSNARKRDVVEAITRRVERDGLFDVIVMAGVVEKNTWCRWWSKSPDVRRIQEELGNKLGLQLHHKTTLSERASRLCDRIKMNAKILIILDDVRGGINLAKIGIPFGNDHKGCKILLLAESQEVLSNQMNTPQIEVSMDDP